MQTVPAEQVHMDPRAELRRRVLVVDDSRLQRHILRATLEKSGYLVTEAESGEQGLTLATETRPDIVLSDWMMPGMDGLEFCRKFRVLPGDSYSYFILLTSKSEKNEVARGLESGADDFLTKPVNGHELRARIRAGERLLTMQTELQAKNRVISDTLTELQLVYDRLDCDLREAKKLQMSLLPEAHQDIDQAEIASLLRSSGHVGGDLVGYYRIDTRRVGIFAIDVSGHGISSALMTARLAGYLSSNAPDQNVAMQPRGDGTFEHLPPNEVISRLNRIILDDMETELYFTMLLGEFDLMTGRMTMSQAGHPHPVVQRRDGQVTQTGPGGLPVGLIDHAEYPLFDVTLAPGDRLFFLSDGVTECPGRNTQMLGESGLRSILSRLHDRPLSRVFDDMVRQLEDFAGTDRFPDDVSGLALLYRGSPSARSAKY